MTNHSEIAEFLWKIADLIKDDYDAKDYENVILPFTLLRRLDCVLQATRPSQQRGRRSAFSSAVSIHFISRLKA